MVPIWHLVAFNWETDTKSKETHWFRSRAQLSFGPYHFEHWKVAVKFDMDQQVWSMVYKFEKRGLWEIEAGDNDGKELQDVDRLTMVRLCQRWNRIGTQDALIKACAAVLTFLCMGRSAEYKFLSGKLRTCTPYLFITNVLTSLLIVSFFQCQLPSCASMWHSKRS